MLFGFGKAKPPLTASRRGQIELRMRYLVDRLTLPVVQQTAIVTDPAVFLPADSLTAEDLPTVAQRIAKQLQVDVSGLPIEVADGGPDAAVHQIGDAPKVRVPQAALSDGPRLVTTLAHEVSHYRLRQFDSREMPDQGQWLTELATLCGGFVVAVCNSSVKESCCSTPAPTIKSLRSLGYLTSADLGYAAACLARLRNETDPAWGKLLRADAQVTFKQAMKSMPAACTMIIDATTIPGPQSSLQQLAEQMVSSNESYQFLAAEQVANRTDESREAFVPALIQMLRSRDEQVVLVAAEALRTIGPAAQSAAPALEHLLTHRVDMIAASAGIALMAIEPNEIVFEHVGDLLENRWSAAIPLSAALAEYGEQAAPAGPSICRRLVTALRRTEDEIIDSLAGCLHSVSAAPMEVIEATISNEEILEWMKGYLASMDDVAAE
ncbi:HEAT repeat domain-containing protein [Rosistilla oblonga]|uniref:HEAT repeat domain-containing protein n=1 Tax=Rosistilla oblonga TaxID=2527990 RepID=UPI003A984696